MPGTLSIGLLAPLSGVMGISGPSIVNCALLAAEHVVERTGVIAELVVIDVGRGPGEVARAVSQLVGAGLVQGLVGAHTKSPGCQLISEISVSKYRAVRLGGPLVDMPGMRVF
jgi:ABC-type branched-subunit amino acid transport system substrate-binding protein